MLLYSTPPLPGCSCLHKVKGSNESSSFPLPYFLFNYLQAVQVLHYFPSPYATLSSCLYFFFFLILSRAFGLSPIPFSSVCAPCSARICCLCSLCCAHMLALPSPPATPCSTKVPSPRSSVCASSSMSQPGMEWFCHGHCSRFHAAATKGNPCCSPCSAQAETALQLLSNWEPWTAQTSPTWRLQAHSAATQGSGDQLGHSPLSCQTINQDANPYLQDWEQWWQCQGQDKVLVSCHITPVGRHWFVSCTHSFWSLSSVSGCNVLYSITCNHNVPWMCCMC